MPRSAFVTAEWLAAHLDDARVVPVDASWYLPSAGRDPAAEFRAEHIPGAAFFAIDGVADQGSALPHMLPPAEDFAAAMRALGIDRSDHVVIYDTAGLLSAPRGWWTFRAFGHPEVSVLEGGLPAWRAGGHPLTDAPREARTVGYTAALVPERLATLAQVQSQLTEAPERIVDARSRGRFAATDPEPRAGLRGGHMPGSRNLPWNELVDGGRLRDPEALRDAFVQSGLPEAGPVITTCGSGITAATLALALFELGRDDVAVYDGSWTEWGGRADTPVEEGPPRAGRPATP